MKTTEGFAFLRPGLHLYYRTVGDGSEAVLIPNANWLAEVLQPLARGRTLIFYDPRSRGRSSAVTNPRELSIEQDVADLEAIRRFFRLDRVNLIGPSYNAAITARYMIENPRRVERLLLVCPITPWRPREWTQEMPSSEAFRFPPGVPRLEEMREKGLDTQDRVAFCRAWLTEFLLPAQMANPEAVARLPVADICSFPNEWPENAMSVYFDHILPKMGDWDFCPSLQSLEQPILVLHGGGDLIPLEASQQWAASSPNARLLIIPGAGHHPYVERPDLFFPAADRFLAGEWPEEAEVLSSAARSS